MKNIANQSQYDQFTKLQSLHTLSAPLVLPNAWDIASALLIEKAGASAVATTSAGMAWSLGYPDGNTVPIQEVIEFSRKLVNILLVPVTIDIEAGYNLKAEKVASLVVQLIEAGVAGINVEDSWNGTLLPIAEHVGRLEAIKSAVKATGSDIFLNARIDTYLLGTEGDVLQATLERIVAFEKAGANGIFIPGLLDLDVLQQVCNTTGLPINVMAGAGSSGVDEFAKSGVRRISTGMGGAQYAYAKTAEAAEFIFKKGSFSVLEGGANYSDMNALFVR